jgi:hypothetical protein
VKELLSARTKLTEDILSLTEYIQKTKRRLIEPMARMKEAEKRLALIEQAEELLERMPVSSDAQARRRLSLKTRSEEERVRAQAEVNENRRLAETIFHSIAEAQNSRDRKREMLESINRALWDVTRAIGL